MAGDTVQAIPGINNAARDVYLGAIDKDGADNVQRNADLYGDPAMLFDYGTGLRGVAEGLATKDGPAASTISDALGYRQAGTNARVQQGLNENFGPAQDPAAVTQSIQDTQHAATGPLFQQAYQQGQLWNPELDALSQRPAVASALQDAATTAANQGKSLPTVTLDQAGNPVASDAAMQAYEAGTRPAVTGAMAQMLGVDPNAGPLSLEDGLVAQRKAASDPLYAAYRQMSVPMTPDLAEVLNRPSVKAAIPSAERKAADQGRTIFAPRPSGFDADPVGSGTPPDMPNYPDPVPLDDTSAPSKPAPVGVPRPQDLQGFIKSAGGMQDPGGDLSSMGLGNLIAKPWSRPRSGRHAAGRGTSWLSRARRRPCHGEHKRQRPPRRGRLGQPRALGLRPGCGSRLEPARRCNAVLPAGRRGQRLEHDGRAAAGGAWSALRWSGRAGERSRGAGAAAHA